MACQGRDKSKLSVRLKKSRGGINETLLAKYGCLDQRTGREMKHHERLEFSR